jgi:hypothetical protein
MTTSHRPFEEDVFFVLTYDDCTTSVISVLSRR